MKIFLIDDNKSRQEIYGWPKIYKDFTNYIEDIGDFETLKNFGIERILSKDNIILIHESFQDIQYQSEIQSFIKSLQKFAETEIDHFHVVWFTGARDDRRIVKNQFYLSAQLLYANIKEFLTQVTLGESETRILLFNKDYNIESKYYNLLESAVTKFDEGEIDDKRFNNIVFKTFDHEIVDPFIHAKNTIIYEDQITDEILHRYVDDLDGEEYSNIYIPLCFGSVLSNHYGLKFALHIRCTDTINRYKPIFLYSFISIDYLINDEYFDVLKTKGIYLIGISRDDFFKSIQFAPDILIEAEFKNEIKKIHLDVPLSYESDHSIKNEWAIFKLALSLPTQLYEPLASVFKNFEEHIYFKYLQNLHPIDAIKTLTEDELKLNLPKSFQNYKNKVLYIDNDHQKGWGIIFNYILKEINQIEFNVLDIDFKRLTRAEIVEKCIEHIFDSKSNFEYNVVLLDFRLCKEDTFERDSQKITGMQILKAIKNINPGIQVIIISATNKIWNLQAILASGANGFLLKEGPENFQGISDSKTYIQHLNVALENSFKLNFLAEVWIKIKKIKSNLNSLFNQQSKKIPIQDSSNLNVAESYLEVFFNLISQIITNPENFNNAYLQAFLLLEHLTNTDCYFQGDDNKLYVVNNDEEILVVETIGSQNKLAIKFENGKFCLGQSIVSKPRRLDINIKISAALIFLFGNKNSSVEGWTKINYLRNSSVAHANKKENESVQTITEEQIFMIIDFLIYFTDQKNFNEDHIAFGLAKKTLTEEIQRLKELNTKDSFKR